MRVLFCHGKEGNPNGTKAMKIREAFTTAVIPRLTNSYEAVDFKNDLAIVQALAKGADVLVGSSRGGALVCQADTTQRKVVIAPAWKKFAVDPKLTDRDVIIHSENDDIVPISDSKELADRFGCRLITCGNDHRMSGEEALEQIKLAIAGE
tara:strand:- start:663 stop:1115 length:453 start_codon:yes stop_codon:yes gene_type:complete